MNAIGRLMEDDEGMVLILGVVKEAAVTPRLVGVHINRFRTSGPSRNVSCCGTQTIYPTWRAGHAISIAVAQSLVWGACAISLPRTRKADPVVQSRHSRNV